LQKTIKPKPKEANMFELHNIFKKNIAEEILKIETIADSFSLDEIYHQFARPPSFEVAHYSFPCFRIAKTIKKNPAETAQLIASTLKLPDFLNHCEPVGPYVNFKINPNFFSELLIPQILKSQFTPKQMIKNPAKTMVEFSQPNTHKELHVGHMRNLCLGDALIKISRAVGVETLSATYPGDMGTHVAKCLWFLKKNPNLEEPISRKGAWLGSLYSQAEAILVAEKGTEKENQNRLELTAILEELHQQKGDFFDLWKKTRQWSLDLMNEVYHWADVKFDRWYFESEVDKKSIKLVQKYFEQGLFVKDDGAIGINLQDYKLGFCILIKTDGNGVYATKDLELARKKFEEEKIEKNIYVVDERQSLHFKQVFKTLELMGYTNATKCHHLAYNFVELPDGPISSRKGNIVPIQELIDKMEQRISQDYLNRHSDSWSLAERQATAHVIAKGAIKYGMLCMDPQKKIIFNMEEWLKLDGDSGPYLQYTFARINSLLGKSNQKYCETFGALHEQNEIELLMVLSELNEVIQAAYLENKPNLLTQYLYSLAKLFNSYYANTSILKAENETLKTERLSLAKAVSLHIKNALALLGIDVPERM
jgi:arginyl-tRNA synthetase